MLVQYTPVSTLSMQEIERLRTYVSLFTELNSEFVMFEGKAIKMNEVRSVLNRPSKTQLNG